MPPVLSEEFEPIFGVEFKWSILHLFPHQPLPVFDYPGREVIHNPVAGMIQRFEIVG